MTNTIITHPSFTTTPDQVFEYIKHDLWTVEHFVRWYEMRTREAYNQGKDTGYKILEDIKEELK